MKREDRAVLTSSCDTIGSQTSEGTGTLAMSTRSITLAAHQASVPKHPRAARSPPPHPGGTTCDTRGHACGNTLRCPRGTTGCPSGTLYPRENTTCVPVRNPLPNVTSESPDSSASFIDAETNAAIGCSALIARGRPTCRSRWTPCGKQHRKKLAVAHCFLMTSSVRCRLALSCSP